MIKTTVTLLLFLAFQNLFASEVNIYKINQWKSDQGIVVSPQFRVSADKPIEEAINNGIIITLIIKTKAVEKIAWWFDKTLKSQKQTYEVRYFSLSGQYQLKNLDNNSQNSFVTLNELWRYLSKKSNFIFNLEGDSIDYFAARFMLDTGALPSTMQLPVLFDTAWDINSDWFIQNYDVENTSTTKPPIDIKQ